MMVVNPRIITMREMSAFLLFSSTQVTINKRLIMSNGGCSKPKIEKNGKTAGGMNAASNENVKSNVKARLLKKRVSLKNLYLTVFCTVIPWL